jgi:hypothetical protein
MTSDRLPKIKESRYLPKDELDNFTDNILGFFPAIIIFIAGLGPFLSSKTTLSTETKWIFLSVGILILAYTIYSKLTERRLKFIHTRLNKYENENLIINISQKEGWNVISRKQFYYEFLFSFVRFHYGFKLTIIPIDDGILLNFRNRGTAQARMPYQFGIETIKQKRIEKIIKNYAQQAVTFTGADDADTKKYY